MFLLKCDLMFPQTEYNDIQNILIVFKGFLPMTFHFHMHVPLECDSDISTGWQNSYSYRLLSCFPWLFSFLSFSF